MDTDVGIDDGGAAVVKVGNPMLDEISDISNDLASVFRLTDSDSQQESRMERYIQTLIEFNEHVAKFKSMIPTVVKLSPTDRAATHNYRRFLFALPLRPRNIRLGVVHGIDELAAFCDAVTVGWRLWPDYCTHLHTVVAYLADATLIEDIKRIDPTFLLTLKEIALQEEWTNLTGGHELSSKAKKILVRYKKDEKEYKAVGQVSILGMITTAFKEWGEHADKKICGGVNCVEIELIPGEFPHCGKCKKVVYHSKECQVKAWEAGHKKACKRQE